MEMHQAVILTSEQIDPETLQKMFRVLQGRSSKEWRGTVFLLKDKMEVANTVSQIELESIYGEIASP